MPQPNENLVHSQAVDAPFEWLTSPTSLDPILNQIFADFFHASTGSSNTAVNALHVGCGSSRLGEHLVERWNVSSVVNADVDPTLLEQMKKRWNEHCNNGRSTEQQERMIFEVVDYSNDISSVHQTPKSQTTVHGPFDMIVDKSTLDCLLCTESAAAHLLQHVYNSLSSKGGIYLLVSFHHVDLLKPLLEGLGDETVWKVQSQVIRRQAEDIRGRMGNADDEVSSNHKVDPTGDGLRHNNNNNEPSLTTTTQWSSGSFEPDAKYHQFANVFICRKLREDVLSKETVLDHVQHVCNQFWTEQNPILSVDRIDQMQQVFGDSALSLPEAYDALFTVPEKEHLDYESFLEDWHCFLSTRSSLDRTMMTLSTAMAFLKEVQ